MENNRVSILLVEDELIIADYMQDCLQKLGYEVQDICINYDEAITALSKKTPDLVLVDINLKGSKSGIELGHYIKQHFAVPFVFATSHNDKDTIDRAKQAVPYAYLIKPFSEEDLYAVIEMALMHFGRLQQKEQTELDDNPVIINDGIFIKQKNKYIKIQIADLLLIEANDNYATLVTNKGKYTIKTSLKNLIAVLPEFFWRTHRSYLINLHHLKGFDTEEVTIASHAIPMGKSFYPLLVEKLKIIQG
ncbi:MAG: DNA-binding response regulator [Sphingobacteriia bacterium]|nr:MAG: DNA-binding response regulator [Sphingobacteriia bacterium]TAH08664.1 MAG: DNA-binding response regulator [Sphingobacteriia bacterium]